LYAIVNDRPNGAELVPNLVENWVAAHLSIILGVFLPNQGQPRFPVWLGAYSRLLKNQDG